jgi:hypothetical protein
MLSAALPGYCNLVLAATAGATQTTPMALASGVLVVELGAPLGVGQTITVSQSKGGLVSDPATTVVR